MKDYRVKTLSKVAEIGLNRLSSGACQLDENNDDPDGVLIRSTKINQSNLNESLLAISRAGVGVNNIPVKECTNRGIVVFNTPGANANAVKELVLAGLMLSSRNIYSSIDFVKSLENLSDMDKLEPFLEENKKQFKGNELANSSLGIVGLGAIGSRVAGMGVALDMNVLGFDPALSVEAAWRLPNNVAPCDSLEDLFYRSDYISLHIPAIDATKEIINKELLQNANESCLLNFARHEVTNNRDILEALDTKNLSTYVTDFPTPELIKRANTEGDVILLPHIGASTLQAEENCAVMAVDQLKDFLENGNIQNSVNFPQVYLPRTTEKRITISNKNIPAMIGKIATEIGNLDLNIADMTNVSRGNIAYNIIDIENEVDEESLKKLRKIEDVISVRLLN